MPSRPISILYIDDDPGLTRLVQKALGRRGYAVEASPTGESGLERLAAGGIDVIALDHYLPTGTGLDFLRELAAIPDRPPVVYVTASGDTAVIVAALKAGAADYVPKAVGDEFLEILGSAIDQAVEKGRLQRARELAEQETRIAKERAEVLLHEVNHRVANSLAIVGSMIRMQANAVTEPQVKQALGEVQSRIAAIAGVHRRLYSSHDVRVVDLSAYLGGLVSELETTMRASGHTSTTHCQIDPVEVPTDKAVTIGILVTELVINAFKYAYPGALSGQIRVILKADPATRLRLLVEDDGVGRQSADPRGTGVGGRIVSAMAASLGATIDYSLPPGCTVSLDFDV
ncbi:MAG TPA: histidine kinase dimerization/phosphoacceptor domain -containing protein [Kaistia sp.]|jgi:two-component sensor histidine kinase|nr:histidine kinase dimerization/phosphoacceptor domain -containing protein [Kaistia sp.]